MLGIEDEVAVRLAHVDGYRERLVALPGVRLQALLPGLRPTPTQLVADFGPRRDEVASALAARGIETRAYFRPMHAMERFRALSAAPLPVTERLGAALLALPLHRGMDAGDVDRVCTAIEAVLG